MHLIISGFVQGVGYRAYALREARALQLHGYVRNLADGSVELLAEGPAAALDALEQRCREGPRFAQVDAVHRSDGPPTGEFSRFEIRR